MAHEDLLASSEFFGGADAEVLQLIAASGIERNLVRGDVLFKEGDVADSLYIVVRGRLAIAIANPIDHRETVVSLMEGVTRLLAQRLRVMDETLADSVFLDVTGRTAKRLLELSEGADEFTLPVTQEELAGMVGASRERVNKAIASFIRLGWIDQHERKYTIIKRQSLEIRAR
jgi:CRP/FNR family cyclic AMP-dependent transcriptional regulator